MLAQIFSKCAQDMKVKSAQVRFWWLWQKRCPKAPRKTPKASQKWPRKVDLSGIFWVTFRGPFSKWHANALVQNPFKGQNEIISCTFCCRTTPDVLTRGLMLPERCRKVPESPQAFGKFRTSFWGLFRWPQKIKVFPAIIYPVFVLHLTTKNFIEEGKCRNWVFWPKNGVSRKVQKAPHFGQTFRGPKVAYHVVIPKKIYSWAYLPLYFVPESKKKVIL